MRHKQRPTKSSRHKSVTLFIGSQTSFSDTNNTSLESSPSLASLAAVSRSTNTSIPQSLLRKQYEHNSRHMSDVMRLAFLENNDISVDECSDNFDFNSLSTASILQRNIQMQIQRERRDLLQVRQQVPPIHYEQHSSLNNNNNDNNNNNNNNNQVNEVSDQEIDQDYGNFEGYEEISDNRIFATATGASNSGSQKSVPSSRSTRHTSHRIAMEDQGLNLSEKPNMNLVNKKRTKESSQRVRQTVNRAPVEAVKNYGEGYFCDEPSCGKSFPSLRKLRHHKVVHSDEFPFVCEFRGCAKKFKRKFGIDLHSTTHFDLDPDMYTKTSNNSSLPFFGRRMQYSMCKPCGQKFKTVHEYQFHMLKHGKEPFKCPVKGCGQTFSIWKSFQKHRASHYFNYYCKMDPKCEHHTSNLQLLKLHIYCCHFRRKLPDNATLTSRDQAEEDEPSIDGPSGSIEPDATNEQGDDQMDNLNDEDEHKQVNPISNKQSPSVRINQQQTEKISPHSPATPRRDSRLRRNPPRSSAFAVQGYASLNKGLSPSKSAAPSTRQLKRSRNAAISTPSSQSKTMSYSNPTPPDKKPKLPLKVLPKRGAQRLPMSLIADDASTEDEKQESDEDYSNGAEDGEDEEVNDDPANNHKFKCHLCDYKFSVRFQLTKHLSTHLELTPDMFLAIPDNKVVQLSEKRRKEFHCDKCNIKFEQMSELDGHMRKHGARPYVCNFCQAPSSFTSARQYLNHLYEHRFNYKCTMTASCDFTINRKDALKLHIFRMHLDQKLPSYIENFASMIDCNDWSEE